MTAKDLSNLPAWARDEIQRLRANEKSLQRKIEEIGGVDSKVCAEFSMEKINLPDDSHVKFKLEKGYISFHLEGDAIEVHGYSGLVIRPRVSNEVIVSLE